VELALDSQNSASAVAVDARSRQLAGLRPFQPGTSGNPGGRPKTSLFRKRSLKRLRFPITADCDQLDAVIDGQIARAIEQQDTQAATFLRDIVDGKPSSNDSNGGVAQIYIAIENIGTVAK
jgi:Family of unknown function (DUF5681)